MIHNFQLSVIIFLLAIALYLRLSKEIDASKACRLLIGFGVFVSIVFYTFYYVANYFTGNGITCGVVYHIKYGLSGAGFAEYLDLILISGLFILLGIIFSLWIFFKRNVHKKSSRQIYFYLVFVLVFLSLLFNPVTAFVEEIAVPKTEKFDFDKNSDFYEFYKMPEITQIGKPKNFIWIYAEGLERTYFNETIFPGLTDNLRKIESESISFTNIMQEEYSHYTMGGVVASQCGIPLVSPSHGNTMGTMSSYLEYAVCLGDLLHDAGYHLVYYGGAHLDFAGHGKFLSTHKFDEAYGKQELLPKLNDQNYVSGWGLYDDTLFDMAYNRFIELSKSKDKFAMFILTLDTHHPDGIPSKSCDNIIYNDGKIPILNAVACSDYLISEFIKRIRQSEYSNNTVIVLVSDHLAMIDDKIFKQTPRTNLFIINEPRPHEGPKISKWASTLDIAPTMLPFIGYKGDIGFGRDIINRHETDEQLQEMHNNLKKWEPYIMQFWNFPKIEKNMEIETEKNEIYLDGRRFKIPLLIELNEELETVLNFDYDPFLISQKNQNFLLIDKCEKINPIVNKAIDYNGYCLLAGKGNKFLTHMMLPPSSIFTTKEIKEMTGLET